MKCIIAGSRNIANYGFIEQSFLKCSWSDKIVEIVSGTARGVDNLGEQLAEKFGLEVTKFPADWQRFGKRAGHLRNADMAKYTDIAIVVMSYGGTNGSLNMIENMRKLGKPCLVFELSLEGELIEKRN